ncbi:hypothetical protein [Psychrobacter phenylpyruvicus]|uniref:Uncharacterized protein n=1 Tax=Psychrobacter phenylpyruvicus TaxID=29432 RepID=A0A379LJG5_9GAMM|nr:hypothetical protein [Psychrobacter phenylpyruvicus]SUD90760.1 Uncharacterised protein [Psychrobacter phenylpyruvicus]SUD98835.1 Uncharacterised protein [Psychrobacter phenylpyruvicus]
MKNDISIEWDNDNLFESTTCIAVFIKNRAYSFVYSYRENFILNMKLDLDLDLKNGELSKKDYDDEIRKGCYRGGIWQLNADNFEEFLALDEVMILEPSSLRHLFIQEFDEMEQVQLYKIVENKLAHNMSISYKGNPSDFFKINQIASRLPLFYINFDTKVYLHMDWDRSHEDYIYEGWFAKALDFGYLIPDSECYWKINGRDFWKFLMVLI